MKTPITKEKIQNHLHYSSWKYILLAVVAVFGWNLIYTSTAPQIPEDKKVVMGIYAYGEQENIDIYMEQTRLTLLPEMLELSAQYITPDEMYGDMILSTRFAAHECDIYPAPSSRATPLRPPLCPWKRCCPTWSPTWKLPASASAAATAPLRKLVKSISTASPAPA